MSAAFHFIEADIRYLPPEEGGRTTVVFSGYRGQFYYDGEDHDGFQYFPDHGREMVHLGTTVRTIVRFRQERWHEVHSKHIVVGMAFEIREGSRTAGRGVVTNVNANIDGLTLEQV